MRKALVAAALAVLVLSGCSATSVVHAPRVQVDTPALRSAKAEAGVEQCPRVTAGAAPSGLPDVTLPCLGGGPSVPIARLRGPLVINLFAQWCGPCRLDLPYYEAFSKKYAGKVGVIGIDWQDNLPSRALALVKATGVTFPLLADTVPRIQAAGLPQVILIDASGKVVFKEGKAITSEKELAALVTKHLGVRL